MREKQKKNPAVLCLVLAVAVAGLVSWIWGQVATSYQRDAVSASGWSDQATPQMLVPVGRAVGIKMFSDGVMVVGMSDLNTDQGALSPARSCGLQEGDIITHINQQEVDSIEEVQDILQNLSGEEMSIRAIRGAEQMQLTTQAVQCSADGTYRLGAWIRDSMAGIGTMTFYDPEDGTFGALGHGINDVDTTLLMPLRTGSILYSEVTDVQKGLSGQPGELHGALQVDRDMGELYANTQNGIFGTLTDTSILTSQEALPVAQRSDLQVGPATILSNIAGETVEEYTIELVRVYPEDESNTRDMMIEITDTRLLETTGGIVQGMSGSPIIQNGKIIGAVTHVLVNDPTRGYGIFIENMLETAEGAGV